MSQFVESGERARAIYSELIMSKTNWTYENVFKLIEMFQEREVLWNTLLVDYKNRNKKHDAWMEIANEFNLDKQTIERKMRSLIGQFQRECKKAKSDESKKWFAFRKLMFLKDQNRPELNADGELEDHYYYEKDSSDAENTGTSNETHEEKTFAVPKTSRKRNRPEENQDRTSEVAIKILKNIYEARQDRDETDAFGEYVTMKLKEIKNTYARNTAQYHINNILYKASIGEYQWPTNMGDTSLNAPGSSRGYSNAPSPSTFSESSQESKPSLDDLLNSIKNK